jgi:hypothetical protein
LYEFGRCCTQICSWLRCGGSQAWCAPQKRKSLTPAFVVRLHGECLFEKRFGLLHCAELKQGLSVVEDDGTVSVTPVVIEISVTFEGGRPISGLLKMARGSERGFPGTH